MNAPTTARLLARATARRTLFRSHHVPVRLASQQSRRGLHLCSTPPSSSLCNHISKRSSISIANQVRQESSDSYRPLTDREETSPPDEDAAARKAEQPSYQMTFTCKKCMERSSHRMTKQAYHFGTVLITCPGCKNRHLIADHLKVFSDQSITIEDIMKEKGQFLKKGRLGADGDVEFYDSDTKPE